MTNILFLVLGLFTASASAGTTLEFDNIGIYYKKNREQKVDLRKFNLQLKKLGLAGLPERIKVGENAEAYGKVLHKRIEEAEKALKQEYFFVIENGYFYEYPAICYRGEASDVPKIIEAMSTTFLNDTQGVLAIRYKDTKLIYAEQFQSKKKLEEHYEEGGEDTQAWLNFDEKSDDVLVMSDLGPQGDGTEVYATTIKPCR